MPEEEQEDRRVDTRRQEDQIEFNIWGAMGPHLKVAGPIVKQITLLASIIGSVLYVGNHLNTGLTSMRMDVLETKLTVKAMTLQMTPAQQSRVAKAVEEQMAFLKMAGLK